MDALRGGGGGRVDARPTPFLEKIHVRAFSSPSGGIFFHEKGLFHGGSHFFFLCGRFWGFVPHPLPPSDKELCGHPCPHSIGTRKSFRMGVGNPKRPLIKTKRPP